MQAKVQNACGWSDWSAAVPIQVNFGYYFVVSPNPANTTISVNPKGETTDDISEIRIYDNVGNLKKQSKYGGGTKQAQLNISSLKSGVYFIEVSGNKAKHRQQLIIQR
ncbi:MAG: T9SS type A sorting domain-containing protein [Agriterribacter sp.]